jgi:hypothetical protein
VPSLRAILGLTALGLCLALGYCGTRPAETIDGSRIESIMAVAERPALFPGLNPEYLPGYGRYLQIDFSAPARLAEAKDGFDGIYPKAGFCPPAPEAQVIALGPYLPDGREFPLTSKEIPRDADGRVRYRIFVVPAYPTPGVKYDSGFNRTPYDLATDLRPLCIELESVGFEFERVRTNRIEIPVDILVGALAALK